MEVAHSLRILTKTVFDGTLLVSTAGKLGTVQKLLLIALNLQFKCNIGEPPNIPCPMPNDDYSASSASVNMAKLFCISKCCSSLAIFFSSPNHSNFFFFYKTRFVRTDHHFFFATKLIHNLEFLQFYFLHFTQQTHKNKLGLTVRVFILFTIKNLIF